MGIVLYGVVWGRTALYVKPVEICSNRLPKSFDGYRIVHISDIHARSFSGREKHLQRAMDKINSLDPDIIAFTGDLITMTPDELDSHAPALSSLKAKDGTFSILGNHDYSMYSDATEETRQRHLETLIGKEKALGWDLLMDENRTPLNGASCQLVLHAN